MRFRKSLKIRLMFVCHKWFNFDCQKQVLDVVLAGHNTLIVGTTRSGKSFLLKQISERTKKAVSVTS